jgi:serine protease Do
MKPLSFSSLVLSAVMIATGCSTTRASLGATTAVPPKELAEEMELVFNVRWQGRLVEEIDPGGAADRAGLEPGDVIMRLGANVLYSQDDLDDYLSLHEPGDEVRATIKRGGSKQTEELAIALGGEQTSSSAAGSPGIEWQYASLAQLPDALEQARAEKKKVLVGLSGAET